MNSKKGTISNAFGEFMIPVKVNDTLVISEIQYESQKVIIDKEHLKNLQLIILLKLKINELNEVTISEHDLTGNLVNDAKNARSENKISEVLQGPDAWKVDMRIVDDYDEIDMEKAPNPRKLTDPTMQSAQGDIIGLLMGLGLNTIIKEVSKIGQKKRAKKREQRIYAQESKFASDRIRNELGDSFFTNNLKIPLAKIDAFIAHCETKGIIDIFLEGKKIAVIDLLIKESKPYIKKLEDEK
jgi:hypothetical protein